MVAAASSRYLAILSLTWVAGCASMGDGGAADGLREGPRRFALTPLTEMTPGQRAVADAIMKGPRAAVGSPAAAAGATSLSSPFNVWNRRPELADRLQKVGEYIRFRSSLPPRLNEFAILVTARRWNAQYEWFAHHRLATVQKPRRLRPMRQRNRRNVRRVLLIRLREVRGIRMNLLPLFRQPRHRAAGIETT